MSAILLCITAGRGPIECQRAVVLALQALRREAQALNVDVSSEGDNSQFGASIVVSLEGPAAENLANSWVGTIQWTSKSGIRASVERKNWFIAVKRLPAPLRVVELSRVRFETLRAGGPGGQHQNKTESAVRAIDEMTGISVVAREGRSQHRNKALALARLQQLITTLTERNQSAQAAKDWLKKIEVERGKPVRVYEGAEFKRRPGG
jgi:peptide chain release factor